MKRTTKVQVKFDNGTTATAIVTTVGTDLTREEAKSQHDEAIDNVVGALRTLPYAGTAPIRNVRVQ